ncbi:MAG: hypothetical protein L0271_12700 [Gemmatimonadetes bacterium]|nr:hypothetical protein [Gemmatimonadota bacterium]
MEGRTIEQVVADHVDALMALRGVVGVAQGLCADGPCIRVFVTDASAAARSAIPDRIEGYPVSVEVTGWFVA